MEHDHHDHHARAPVMEAADEPPAGQLGQDVAEAVIGVAGSRRVIEGEQRSGERLRQKQENRDAAEYLVPPARRRDLLVQKVPDGGVDARAVIDPVVEETPTALHAPSGLRRAPSSSFDPWTFTS